jgi:hypothetical protein
MKSKKPFEERLEDWFNSVPQAPEDKASFTFTIGFVSCDDEDDSWQGILHQNLQNIKTRDVIQSYAKALLRLQDELDSFIERKAQEGLSNDRQGIGILSNLDDEQALDLFRKSLQEMYDDISQEICERRISND